MLRIAPTSPFRLLLKLAKNDSNKIPFVNRMLPTTQLGRLKKVDVHTEKKNKKKKKKKDLRQIF